MVVAFYFFFSSSETQTWRSNWKLQSTIEKLISKNSFLPDLLQSRPENISQTNKNICNLSILSIIAAICVCSCSPANLLRLYDVHICYVWAWLQGFPLWQKRILGCRIIKYLVLFYFQMSCISCCQSKILVLLKNNFNNLSRNHFGAFIDNSQKHQFLVFSLNIAVSIWTVQWWEGFYFTIPAVKLVTILNTDRK